MLESIRIEFVLVSNNNNNTNQSVRKFLCKQKLWIYQLIFSSFFLNYYEMNYFSCRKDNQEIRIPYLDDILAELFCQYKRISLSFIHDLRARRFNKNMLPSRRMYNFVILFLNYRIFVVEKEEVFIFHFCTWLLMIFFVL